MIERRNLALLTEWIISLASGKIRPCKFLVETAWILHDTDFRTIDGRQTGVLVRIFLATKDGLAVFEIAVGHEGLLFSGVRDGNSADCDVKFLR